MSVLYPGEDNDYDSNYIVNTLVNWTIPTRYDHLYVDSSMVQRCEGMLLNVSNGVDCACKSTWRSTSRKEVHKCKQKVSTEPDDITKIPKECMPCEDTCPICLDSLDACCVITKCKHKFHEKCISKYFETAPREWFGQVKCPMCRGSIWPATFMDLHRIFEQHKNCNCCSRHKINRPRILAPLNTGRVEWCLNINRLKNNNSIRDFNCKCPCRHILRWNCCRRLQDN